jgi:peptidoglycan/LPS O-acetylase OafA/YrhL
MSMRKALVPTLIVGLAFAVSIVAVSELSYWRFWGLFFGGFTVALTFGISLWAFDRRSPHGSSIGRKIVIVTLTVFGLLVVNWIAMWGFSPFTLEGAWIYPLAIVPLATVVILLWQKRRGGGRDALWSRPPGK